MGDTDANLLKDPASLLHQINKSLEVMFSVVRTGRRFGMILNRDDGQSRMAHALDTLVVEVDVRHFHFSGQAVGLHRKAVIVRGNLNVAAAKVFDRLATAAMTKDQ